MLLVINRGLGIKNNVLRYFTDISIDRENITN